MIGVLNGIKAKLPAPNPQDVRVIFRAVAVKRSAVPGTLATIPGRNESDPTIGAAFAGTAKARPVIAVAATSNFFIRSPKFQRCAPKIEARVTLRKIMLPI